MAKNVIGVLMLGIAASSVGVLAFSYGYHIEASVDREGLAKECPPSQPILVQVRNRTFSTIKRVHFRMELFKGERSLNLLSDSRYVFDYVVRPFSRRSLCYSDEYTDHLLGVHLDRGGAQKHMTVNLSDLVSNLEAARVFGSSHSVYISDVSYELIE